MMANTYLPTLFLVFAQSLVLLSTVVESELTAELCSSIDKPSFDAARLFLSATTIANAADEALVPSKFYRVIDGTLVTIVDEEDGEDSGGGTNTFGVYGTFLVNGTENYPEQFCNTPTSEGKQRCSAEVGGMSMSFLLGPADVIAIPTCTPPPVKYFSYDYIISVRTNEEFPFYPGQNFGDTINHLNVNVSDSSTPFNQPAILIASGDGTNAAIVAGAYMAVSGLTQDSISTRGITDKTVRFWDRSNGKKWSDPDLLSFISRVSVPLGDGGMDDPAYAAFKLTKWPVRFYLANDDAVPTDPLHPPLRDRCSENIINETQTLFDGLQRLNYSIQTGMNASFGPLVNSLPMNLTAEGFYDDWDAILDQKNNDSFVAGTRDATYGIPIEFERYTAGMYCFIIGVVHSKVLNSAYSSVGLDIVAGGVYSETHWWLDDDLEGSAVRFLSTDDEDAPFLFAVEVRPPGACATAQYPQWCVEFNASSADTVFNYIMPGERVYSVNETHIGSCASGTIPSEILVFKYAEQVEAA